MRWIVTYGFYPASLVASTAAALALIDQGMALAQVVIWVAVPFLALVFALELACPQTLGWRTRGRDLWVDLLHSVLSNTIPPALVRILFAATLAHLSVLISARVGVAIWPEGWPLLAQLGLALVVGELAFYVQHRFWHETRLFPFHAIHHSTERMYLLAASRIHPVQVFVSYGLQLGALWALGVPEQVITLYLVVTSVHGMVQHSNIELRTGFLCYLLATPEIHRWHHSRAVEESNANYSNTILLWDWVFRSRHYPGEPTRLYPDGLGLPPEDGMKTKYLAHLVYPFVRLLRSSPEPEQVDQPEETPLGSSR